LKFCYEHIEESYYAAQGCLDRRGTEAQRREEQESRKEYQYGKK
jgi:hypothetical protein